MRKIWLLTCLKLSGPSGRRQRQYWTSKWESILMLHIMRYVCPFSSSLALTHPDRHMVPQAVKHHHHLAEKHHRRRLLMPRLHLPLMASRRHRLRDQHQATQQVQLPDHRHTWSNMSNTGKHPAGNYGLSNIFYQGFYGIRCQLSGIQRLGRFPS